MKSFWVISIIVLAFPVALFMVGYLKQALKVNLPHILVLALVSFFWLFYQYHELTCITKECIEWQVSANGGILIVQELFPLAILVLLIPWSLVIFNRIRNKFTYEYKSKT